MLETLSNSKTLATLSFLVTILTSISAMLNEINFKYGIIILTISGIISALVTRIQPTPQSAITK